MKNSVIKIAWAVTIYLVCYTILAHCNVPFALVFALCCTGQLFFLYLVYKVLTDSYTTDKTFKDRYEDHPVQTLDRE